MGISDWWRRLWSRGGGSGPAQGGQVQLPARRSRAEQIALLQEGYQQMLELARAVRTHLERQAEVQEKMLNVLERLPSSLDTIRQLGEGARQQTAVLETINDNLKKAAEEDRHLAEGLDRFGRILGQMEETSRGTARTVSRLMEQARESEELLRDLVVRSERRVTYLVTLLSVITVLAAGSLALVYGLRYWQGMQPAERASGEAVVAGAAGAPPIPEHSITEIKARGPGEGATVAADVGETLPLDEPGEPQDALSEEEPAGSFGEPEPSE